MKIQAGEDAASLLARIVKDRQNLYKSMLESAEFNHKAEVIIHYSNAPVGFTREDIPHFLLYVRARGFHAWTNSYCELVCVRPSDLSVSQAAMLIKNQDQGEL